MNFKLLFTTFLCSFKLFTATAQTNHEEILPPAEKTEDRDERFVSVEKMPVYPGGEKAMFTYIAENIKYPEDAKKMGIEGTVYVYFVIDRNGNVRDAEVKRGVKGSDSINKEALRVVSEMPQWSPGYQNNKPASVQFTLPIKFTLNNTSEKK